MTQPAVLDNDNPQPRTNGMLHAFVLAFAQSAANPASAVDVPVRHVAGRVIAEPRTADGQT